MPMPRSQPPSRSNGEFLLPHEIWLEIFKIMVCAMKIPIWNAMLVNRNWHDIIRQWSWFWSHICIVGRVAAPPTWLPDLSLYPRIASIASWTRISSKIHHMPIHLTVLVEFGQHIGVPGKIFYNLIQTILRDRNHSIAEFGFHIVNDNSNSTPHPLDKKKKKRRNPHEDPDSYAHMQQSTIQQALCRVLYDPIKNIRKLVIQDPLALYGVISKFVFPAQTALTHLEYLYPHPLRVQVLAKFPYLETCSLYLLTYDHSMTPFTLQHLRTWIITQSSFAAIALVQAPSLERLLVHQELRSISVGQLPYIHFPSLHSFRVSSLHGHFIPHFPTLENAHLGMNTVGQTWLLDFLSAGPHSCSPTRLSFTVSNQDHLLHLEAVFANALYIHTLQIEYDGTDPHQPGPSTHALLKIIQNSVGLRSALRCLELTGLTPGDGLEAGIRNILQVFQPKLNGLTYQLYEESEDKVYCMLKCAGDCCEPLRLEFDDPDKAFYQIQYDE